MGRIINIGNKLDREPRFLVIDEEHRYKVDCRKNTIIRFMEITDQIDNSTNPAESMEAMDNGLKLLVGEAAFREIEEMDFPFSEWQLIFKAATAVAMNKDLEDIDADFREAEGEH